MDDTQVDPEHEEPAALRQPEPSGGVAPSEKRDPDTSMSRWKKRALWAAAIAAGAAAAFFVYDKVTAGWDDPLHDDDLSDDRLWADDSLEAEEDDQNDENDDWVVDEDLRDYLDEQEEIVGRLTSEVETLDEDEWQSLYDQLDVDHQIRTSDDLADRADDAVGHPSWRSDA